MFPLISLTQVACFTRELPAGLPAVGQPTERMEDTAETGDPAGARDSVAVSDTCDFVRPEETLFRVLLYGESVKGDVTLAVTRRYHLDSSPAVFGDVLVSVPAWQGESVVVPSPDPADETPEDVDGLGIGARYWVTLHDDTDGDGAVDDDETVRGATTAELLWMEGVGWGSVDVNAEHGTPMVTEVGMVQYTPEWIPTLTGASAVAGARVRLLAASSSTTMDDVSAQDSFTVEFSAAPVGGLVRPIRWFDVGFLAYDDLDGSGSYTPGDSRLGGVWLGAECLTARFVDLPRGLAEAWSLAPTYTSELWPLQPGWMIGFLNADGAFYGFANRTGDVRGTLEPGCTPKRP
jgi:hypothetical protein